MTQDSLTTDQETNEEEDEGLRLAFRANGGRIGFFKGAVASGEDISPGTDVRGNIRDDNPFFHPNEFISQFENYFKIESGSI